MSDIVLREGMDRTSACVAPLTIKKKPSATWNSDGAQSMQSSPKSRRTTGSITSQFQMSPPLTPRANLEAEIATAEPESFPNYLRAFYHFHPSSTISSVGDECSITVPINQGDVILVHSIHPNGWADGTLLISGARGWLPTNYCEPFDHPSIHNLLNALTRLWDLVRSGESGNTMVFAKQDYVRSMIAGVRFLLEKSDCLTRENQTVQAHIGIRRMRKGLLSDLSSLVKTAKHLQQVVSQSDPAEEPIYDLLDELVLKAFKVVTRAVRFLDVFAQEIQTPSQLLADAPMDEAERPLTPPHDVSESNVEQSQSAEDGATEPPESVTAVSPTDAARTGDEPASASNINTPRTNTSITNSVPVQSLPALSPSKSTPSKRVSISHRASYTSQVSGQRRHNLASERLSAAQDSFLGSIGSFIGLHLQSRSSSELLSTTQQSVVACRQLLSVVEEVWERDARRSEPLSQARDAMHEKLSELVQATKDMFAHTEAHNEECMPAQGKEIVIAATNCVRAAGDCVTKAKIVIERIGDFEFERTGATISDTIFESLDLTGALDATNERTSQDNITKPLPAPPKAASRPTSLDEKPLPEPPASLPSPSANTQVPSLQSPTASSFRSSKDSLPSLAKLPIPHLPPLSGSTVDESPSTNSVNSRFAGNNAGLDSVNASDSTSTYPNSLRGDAASIISHTSTRATTPDDVPSSPKVNGMISSYPSVSELRSTTSEDAYGVEEQLMEKTYVHELIYKDGQIAGGSLPALVEQLTTHEATPDAMFVTTFYLTFRLFTTPVELAHCLIERFNYVGESSGIAVPVWLRVHNVFKGWLESHWQADTDAEALGLILTFATGKLRTALPSAGKRLAELVAKVSQIRPGTPTPHLTSSLGKTSTSATVYTAADPNVPNPIVSKSQMNALRNLRNGASITLSILDFDPLEMARQFTLIESKLFCTIKPEELLASEWTKKNGRAVNVRAMSKLSTDLANLVADTILQLEDPKKRAVIIKQWVKIATKCLELNNYDSLMAIICSLNSSMVMRLKRTWDVVSAKTKGRLEELRAIVNVGRNYAVLRKRLENHVAPCIPFVGIYLTDLTFVDVGNQTTRQLPGDGGADSGISVINFDKHMRTAKIIGQLQRFQVPYPLAPVPEMQEWMQTQIERVRDSDQSNVQSYYRRSLLLEPREAKQPSPLADNESVRHFKDGSGSSARERFDFLNALSTFKSSSEHNTTQRGSL
ncbi:ras guanine-nucleotide exchange protein [Diplodia corticola]|uniref:Ras guanine-nucleotide exchange protein n=1 Tax=Diplodia corticola TaxID=236234 RepID=A0A1J9R317_9PEZI|nr:ras guanine-nucleotide exchange protein [Diplodia corticola]OJD34969.1 ras guanine-nucleotide exchange protein [Diplodia corticola]